MDKLEKATFSFVCFAFGLFILFSVCLFLKIEVFEDYKYQTWYGYIDYDNQAIHFMPYFKLELLDEFNKENDLTLNTDESLYWHKIIWPNKVIEIKRDEIIYYEF